MEHWTQDPLAPGSLQLRITSLKPGTTASKPVKQLACKSCRRKKVKCRPHPSNEGCTLCVKLGTPCFSPEFDERRLSSRKLIRELYDRIALLEEELQEHRDYCVPRKQSVVSASGDFTEPLDDVLSPAPSSTPSVASEDSNTSDNMIVRLCGGQRQLNSDRVGRLRFFGPTSSLHLTESVTSSILIRETNGTRGQYQWQDDLSQEVQNYLLDLYWTYQHNVVPVIHKEAFLRDLNSGQTQYCSTLLVYCILARAAAISDQAELRALALSGEEDDDPPYFIKQCEKYLDIELKNPGITTLQSLQLLSEIYCAVSNDTKGWMDAGGACRLAFELGLHSDSKGLSSAQLSQMDLEVRQMVFWGCFSLDRQWALYLGRPQCIKLNDVSVKRPEYGLQPSWEMKMSVAWASLLEILGDICDALNGVQTTRHRVTSLDQKLRDWQTSLDPLFIYSAKQAPPAFQLHMQYSGALILLHRPLARFGNAATKQAPSSEISRQICVENACRIAQYLQEYEETHGRVSTMSWVAVHMIAIASTTLIANVAERKGDTDTNMQLSCLQKCIRSLNELEKSHVATRRVRKVIQHAVRLLNLDATVAAAPTLTDLKAVQMSDYSTALTFTDTSYDMGLGAVPFENMAQPFSFDEFLPRGSTFDNMNSFETYFSF